MDGCLTEASSDIAVQASRVQFWSPFHLISVIVIVYYCDLMMWELKVHLGSTICCCHLSGLLLYSDILKLGPFMVSIPPMYWDWPVSCHVLELSMWSPTLPLKLVRMSWHTYWLNLLITASCSFCKVKLCTLATTQSGQAWSSGMQFMIHIHQNSRLQYIPNTYIWSL